MGKGGQRTEASIASDPMFGPFLGEHFDAMEYASTSLSSSSATAQVVYYDLSPDLSSYPGICITGIHTSPSIQAKTAQLQQGLKILDDKIRAEVQLRQQDLLQQAECLREAQSFMQASSARISTTLHIACSRLPHP